MTDVKQYKKEQEKNYDVKVSIWLLMISEKKPTKEDAIAYLKDLFYFGEINANDFEIEEIKE